MSSSTMNFQEDYKLPSSLCLPDPYRQELQSHFKDHSPLTPSFINLKAQLIATYLCLTTTLEKLPIGSFLCIPVPFRKEIQSTLKKSLLASSSTTISKEDYKFSSSLRFWDPHRQELQSSLKGHFAFNSFISLLHKLRHNL